MSAGDRSHSGRSSALVPSAPRATGRLARAGVESRGREGRLDEGLEVRLERAPQPLAPAAGRGVTPAQLAIGYVRAKAAAQGITLVPTLGSRTRAQLANALGGLALGLSAEDLATIEAAAPAASVAGSRYAEALMKHLDSER